MESIRDFDQKLNMCLNKKFYNRLRDSTKYI